MTLATAQPTGAGLSAVTPGNTPLGEIIRRKLNPYSIPRHDSHEIHLHLPGEMREYQVFPIRSVYLDAEYRIWQRLCYRALDFNRIALGHTILSNLNRQQRAIALSYPSRLHICPRNYIR